MVALAPANVPLAPVKESNRLSRWEIAHPEPAICPEPGIWNEPLRAFARLDRQLAFMRRVRAASYATVFAFGSALTFLLQASPHHYELPSQIVLLGLVAAGVIAPIAGRLQKRIEKDRNALARRFFDAGLRPEGHGRLVTNVAHPQVVADLRHVDI